MLILPLFAFAYIVSIRYARTRSRVRACIDAYVLCAALAVAIAEATSLFRGYDLIFVSLCWGLILLAAICLHRRICGAWTPCKGILRGWPLFSKWERIILFAMAGTVLFVLARILISPPCSPVDSLVYHMPKAFMYYKNQSIHNFPADLGHMLYFGPLNAILMSQSQILSFGWDGFYSYVQYLPYMLCMLAVFQITRLICGNRTYALIAAAMTCFMPVAHLQASTTQCDLLVTAFCVIAVYYMVQIYFDVMQGAVRPADFLLLGFSCGLAVLSKLNAGVVLIGFSLLFAVFLIIRLRGKAIRNLLIVLLCALLMVSGFWTRNALDWDGDFLPLSYSGSRPDYEALGAKGVAVVAAKALAITFASPGRKMPAFTRLPSLLFANAVANLAGMDVNDPLTNEPGSEFAGYAAAWPDNASYPVHSLLVLAALLFCVVYAIRKKRWWLLGYALCCMQAILVTATQYQWCNSYNRYLMPAFIIALPLTAYFLQKLFGSRRSGTVVCSALLCCMFLLNALVSVIYTQRFYIAGGVGTYTYNERIMTSHEYHPIDLWRQVLDTINRRAYTKIGLTGRPSGGNYIWMRPFADAAYTVRYVNASVRSDLEDPDFIPDCIIATFHPDSIPEAIEYHGVRYAQTFAPGGTWWPSGDMSAQTCFVYYEKMA